MCMQTIRALSIAGLSLWLAGCNTTSDTAGIADSKRPGADAYAAGPPPSSMLIPAAPASTSRPARAATRAGSSE